LAQTVVVLPFTGPRAAQARTVIVRALDQDYDFVSPGEWAGAAKQLGLRGRSSRTIGRVATELGAKAVVSGGVRRVRGRWRLFLTVRDGAGEVVGRRGAATRNPARLSDLARGFTPAVVDLVARLVRESAGGGGGDSAGRADGLPPDEAVESGTNEASPAELPNQGGGSGESSDNGLPAIVTSLPESGEEVPQMMDDEEALGEGGGEASPSQRRTRQPRRRRRTFHSNPYGWLDLDLLANVTQRHFLVPIDPLCDGTQRRYAELRATFGEMGAHVAFYPGGIVTSRWPAGFGLSVSFLANVGLAIRSNRSGDVVDASQYAYTVGARYRWSTGTASRGITIMGQLGVGRYSFALSNKFNDLVPTFVYDYVYLGLDVYVPLSTDYVGVALGVDYNPVFNSGGSRALEAYNGADVDPSIHGFSTTLGLGGQIVSRFRWHVGFELLGFFGNHQGKGAGLESEGDDTACRLHCETVVNSCVDDIGNPVVGGIRTSGTAKDIVWRIGLQLSYRFGWNPDRQPPNPEDEDEEEEVWDEDEEEEVWDEEEEEEEEEDAWSDAERGNAADGTGDEWDDEW
jgi:hypothetical protein